MPVYLSGPLSNTGYGSSTYGDYYYGSIALPRPPVATTGGFGGNSYSTSSYGSAGYDLPRITYAISLSGFVIRVYFSAQIENNADLVNINNYLLSEIYGVPVTILQVTPALFGEFGVLAIDLIHTGTTLGGNYHLQIFNIITSVNGWELITPGNEISFYTLGDTGYSVATLDSPDNGKTVNLQFYDSLDRPQPLLTELEFSPGVEDVNSYSFNTDYPIQPVITSVVQNLDLSTVRMSVDYMTTLDYDVVSGPASSMDYTGGYLPEDSTEFTGVPVGVGTSSVATDGLFLSKTNSNVYGYEFLDTSTKLLPNSSFRFDFKLDFTQTTINPPVLDSIFTTLHISDGLVGITLNLRDVSGYKIIQIVSGTYTTEVLCDWTDGSRISLLRNQKAGVYTVICNGYPQHSFPVTSVNGTPTIASGVSFVLDGNYDVSLLKLTQLKVTSSQTLFTNAWNFIHNMTTSLLGSGLLTNGTLKTKRGPLVRGWGDNTPAEIEDVHVYIDGLKITLQGVNPYIGEVYPLVPIPLIPIGLFTITVDYKWFKNPQMGMLGLNKHGLNLNTWDRSINRNTTSTQTSLGVTKTNRFPMGISLGPTQRSIPKEIGYKYIGFQNDYSALLNSQHLLLLNKNPHAISEGNIQASAVLDKGLFNGRTTPTEAGWSIFGLDTGYVNTDGTYTLVDNTSGSYSLGYEANYYKETDLSLETFLTLIGRFKIDTYTPDGVFTGVGVGVYDGSNVGLVGALDINGVQHFGLLLDGTNPHLQDSWEIGFKVEATGLTQNIITIDYSSLPNGVASGDRLVIYEGGQSGIYTIASCGLNLAGNVVEITLVETLPLNVNQIGQDKFNIYFETKWDTDLVSVRNVYNYPTGTIDVYIGSNISGLFLSNQTLIPYPAQTSLLLPNPDKGVVFWGSISRKATNTSTWDLVQYINSPVQLLETLQGKTVSLDMNTLPQQESMFYLVGGFGSQFVDSGLLTLNTDSSSNTIDVTNYYETVEPYLSNKTKVDVQTTFNVTLGNNSYGEHEVYMEDGKRRASLYTLRYYEDPVGRYLLTDTPTISLSGLLAPQNDGWVSTGTVDVNTTVTGQTLNIDKTSTQITSWNKSLTDTQFSLGCVFETTLTFNSYTLGTAPLNVVLDVVGVGESRQVIIKWEPTQVLVTDSVGTVLITYPISLVDSTQHTYKLVCDPQGDVVSLFVDNTLQGTTLYSSLTLSSKVFSVGFNCTGTSVYNIDLDYLYLIPYTLHPSQKTTIGLLKRDGSLNDINSYVIPRTDGTQALNSSLTAIPFEQDFTSPLQVRLLRDPTLGLALYLPNELMPNGNVYIPGTEEVSNAWAYVEYRNLPVHITQRGHIGFGSVLPQVISQVVVDDFTYSVKKPNVDYGVAPQGMVLNRAITLTSGEYNYDISLEDYTFESRSSTLVYIPDSGVYASRVFKLIVDNVVIPSTDYTFDRLTQYIVLSTPLTSSTVRVIFNPGNPISKTYLCSQPVNQTVTVLNEGTPIIPTSKDYYSDVQVCTKEQGNDVPITFIDDNTGFQDIEIEGHFTTDNKPLEQGVAGVYNKSSSIISGTATLHNAPALHLSGGSYTGMVLPTSTVSTMLYTNIPGQQMGMNQQTLIQLSNITHEDTFTGIDDNNSCAYTITDYGISTDRLGPWGGLTSLTEALLGGGVQESVELFVLQGGTHIIPPTITEGVLS